MADVEEISYIWRRVVSDDPKMGDKVLIWDPIFGAVLAVRCEEGFMEALGIVIQLGPIEWWMPLPLAPPGERQPAVKEIPY